MIEQSERASSDESTSPDVRARTHDGRTIQARTPHTERLYICMVQSQPRISLHFFNKYDSEQIFIWREIFKISFSWEFITKTYSGKTWWSKLDYRKMEELQQQYPSHYDYKYRCEFCQKDLVAIAWPCSNFAKIEVRKDHGTFRDRLCFRPSAYPIFPWFKARLELRTATRDTRVSELFVVATVCTRDNTHASTQKIRS